MSWRRRLREPLLRLLPVGVIRVEVPARAQLQVPTVVRADPQLLRLLGIAVERLGGRLDISNAELAEDGPDVWFAESPDSAQPGTSITARRA